MAGIKLTKRIVESAIATDRRFTIYDSALRVPIGREVMGLALAEADGGRRSDASRRH